jgi:hypothetical protein
MTAHVNTRTISDEDIYKIRKLLESTSLSSTAIMEKVGTATFDNIRNIKNKILLPTTEMNIEWFMDKQKNKNEKKQQTNLLLTNGLTDKDVHALRTTIGKRKISAEMAIKLIVFKSQHPDTTVKDMASKSEELFGCVLSSDVIRALCSGKTKMFEHEFPLSDVTYDEYNTMIQTYQSKMKKRV